MSRIKPLAERQEALKDDLLFQLRQLQSQVGNLVDQVKHLSSRVTDLEPVILDSKDLADAGIQRDAGDDEGSATTV